MKTILSNLKEKDRLRALPFVENKQGIYIIIDEKKYINLSSNDYLGISSNNYI